MPAHERAQTSLRPHLSHNCSRLALHWLGCRCRWEWRATKPRYVYVVHGVSAAKGVAKAPIDHVSAAITKAIEAEPKISHELPADAPSHKSEPEKFKRFLAKKKLEAFRVNAEVVAYKKTIEENERGRKVVVVHVDVRLFGETMPDRVMAFAG